MRSFLISGVLNFLFLFFFTSCDLNVKLSEKQGGATQFELMDPTRSGINFTNSIKETLHFNFINYSYIFNGGGVATGDINNDGLIDIYFTANQTENRLYLNKGNFQFEDITKSSGTADKIGWSNGVTMIDINNDGWLDIYVCKSGSLKDNQLRANKLFINQRNNTFKEEARKWGVDYQGFSTQSYFLDHDNDGDLDLFLVNHRADFEKNDEVIPINDVAINKYSSNHLFRRDKDRFIRITEEAGLESMTWGLSAAIGDFNNDGWEDIYVCNDFLQPDFLYINNQKGGFTNEYLDRFDHLSQHSMGSDFADINNDGYNDLIVLEMSPEDHVRSKKNMPSMSSKDFNMLVKTGYHNQYMINTLQMNESNGYFSDIAQMAGVAKTDWSWAPLLADFDEDGYNDLFVTNGVMKDLANSDYREKIMDRIASRVKMSLEEAQAMVPSNRLKNYIYQNKGDLTFKDRSHDWGINLLTFSNGAAYADLDNDGDLDLVVNNVMDTANVYRNNSTNNSISIELTGPESNTSGIGSKVEVVANGQSQVKTQYLSRGYISSVSKRLHFGIGTAKNIELVKVTWPDGRVSMVKNPDLTAVLSVPYVNSIQNEEDILEENKIPLESINPSDLGLSFEHKEDSFNDFDKQLLLPHKLSQQGPSIGKADVNGDGWDDVYICGAAGQSGQLYVQGDDGFEPVRGPWESNESLEETGVLFFDYDGDGDQDLYVVSGSYEFDEGDKRLIDELYKNDGNGRFSATSNVIPDLPLNGKIVRSTDFDGDGDLDLFLGGRLISGQYPLSPRSYLLENKNGKFTDVTATKGSDILNCGMVTGAEFSDFDQDGDDDLVVVGEWSAIQIFENNDGAFSKANIPDLDNSHGLWFSIKALDIDQDGDEDYLVGNLGKNTKFKVGDGKEFHIYSDDFDQSGNYDIILTNKYKGNLVPVRGLECSSEQIPVIKTAFKSFQSFASATLADIYGEQNLNGAHHIQADLLHSILLINKGNGQFERISLPNEAQTSTIMGFEVLDIDGDGFKEILAVGNLYESEIETVRYDASKGIVIQYKEGELINRSSGQTGFFVKGNARDVEVIRTKSGEQVLVVRNNDEPLVFKLNNLGSIKKN